MMHSDGSKQPVTPTPAMVWRRRIRLATGHALGALGRTLISIGVLLLLFVVYQLWGTGLHEARAQHALSSEFDRLVSSQSTVTTTAPSTTTLAPSTTEASTEPAPTTTLEVQPDDVIAAFRSGDAVARIRIPKIGVDKIVVEGVDVDDLRKGPGHYRSTPMPGQRGNAAIAGHRTTYGAPFNRIDELDPGDEISVVTPQGDFTYKVLPQKNDDGSVSGHLVVSPSDVWVLNDMGDNRLTLTACHPKYSASQRIVVQAILEVPPALTPKLVTTPTAIIPRDTTDTVGVTTTLPAEPVLPSDNLDAGLGGDHGQRWPTFFWAVVVAIFLLAVGQSTKRWGRLRSWATSAIPMALVVFVFFEHLDRMLPAR